MSIARTTQSDRITARVSTSAASLLGRSHAARRRSFRSAQSGMTLLELILSCAILLIIAGAALPLAL